MRRLAFLVGLLAGLAPGSASACSCVEVSAADSFAAHAAVFEGRVIEVRRPADPSGALVAVMEVVQHWKGITTERVEVSTPAASSMCGIAFEPETSWLVYADAAGDGFTTGLCDRTRRIEDAAEDVAAHGAGVVPVEVTEEDEVEAAEEPDEPPARGGCGSCAGAPGGSSGALALLALAAFVVTRRTGRTRASTGRSPAA